MTRYEMHKAMYEGDVTRTMNAQRFSVRPLLIAVAVVLVAAGGFAGYALLTRTPVPDSIAQAAPIFNTPTITRNPATQTAIQSATIDAATRIAIAAHQLQFTSPQPVSVLNPTPIILPNQPTATLPPTTRPDDTPAPTATAVPAPGTISDLNINSPILGRSLPMRMYLPPNYDSTTSRYPVLYMLHCGSASYKEWSDYSLQTRADQLIRDGKIPPFIIVLPMGESSYWVNHADGTRWADYVATDVVGYVDAHYRTLANATNRAIGGLSMGAYGAVEIALTHPNTFSIIGVHSMVVRPQSVSPEIWGTDPAFYAAVNPIELAKKADFTSYTLWVDVGKDDKSARVNTEDFHNALVARNIPHTWNLYDGAHEKSYWDAHVPFYLDFYGQAFAANARSRARGRASGSFRGWHRTAFCKPVSRNSRSRRDSRF